MQMITHFMIMQLNYPAVSTLFYGLIFEFVNFDIVPTDPIYGYVFAFKNEPYSEQAEETGYESGLFIVNSGSFLIYVCLIILT